MARNLMAWADLKVAEKQAPFDIETQRPNDFVQYQKEENQAGHSIVARDERKHG
jgi:hypothetical protein